MNDRKTSGAERRRWRGALVGMALLVAALHGACRDAVIRRDTPVDHLIAEATAVHFQWLQYFIDGDAEGFTSVFGPDVVDLGGAVNGTGELPPGFLDVARWDSIFARNGHRRDFGGRTIDELLIKDSTLASVVWREEDGTLDVDPLFKTLPYAGMREGDVMIGTFPRPGSTLNDGWFGVYRKIGGRWRVVAFD